jgi:hypothetical protein
MIERGLDDFPVFQLFDGLQAGAMWIAVSEETGVNLLGTDIALKAT